ncbi:MAG: hypothetical protein WBC93_06275 [Sulfitobacter sp.]
MPRDGSNVYSKPTGTTAVASATIESAKYNAVIDDLVTDANTARPIVAGGTGGTSASAARTLLGVPATADVQAVNANLTSLSGLTLLADRGLYSTAANTLALFTLTAAGRALLDDASASAQRTTLGLGTMATKGTVNDGDPSISPASGADRSGIAAIADFQIAAAGVSIWDYESAKVTAGTTQQTFTHGLGATPSQFDVFLECTTANVGYAVGDIVKMSSYEGNGARGFAVWANATLIGATGSSSFFLANKTTGSVASATPASWDIFARAKL